jgi:hypothetical protein
MDKGQRLCLLVTASGVRCALEATSVVEVAPGSEADGRARRFQPITDLSALLGGRAQSGAGMAILLDSSPPIALRVSEVLGVSDVSRAPFLQLPPELTALPQGAVRGALVFDGKVFLELRADALGRLKPSPNPPTATKPALLTEVAERALVFESNQVLYGLPLTFTSQVVAMSEAACPMPIDDHPIVAIMPHQNTLWPVYSVPRLLGQNGVSEPFVVLAEPAGRSVGLLAERPLGVHSGFTPTEQAGHFKCKSLGSPVLFLDLHRMFS